MSKNKAPYVSLSVQILTELVHTDSKFEQIRGNAFAHVNAASGFLREESKKLPTLTELFVKSKWNLRNSARCYSTSIPIECRTYF